MTQFILKMMVGGKVDLRMSQAILGMTQVILKMTLAILRMTQVNLKMTQKSLGRRKGWSKNNPRVILGMTQAILKMTLANLRMTLKSKVRKVYEKVRQGLFTDLKISFFASSCHSEKK